MAYFPNGTSGMAYMDRHCCNCANWKDNGSGSEGCYVMDLHTLWNYEACNGDQPDASPDKKAKYQALEHFIPTTKDGMHADDCKMFHPLKPDEQVVDKSDALREWEAIYGKRS